LKIIVLALIGAALILGIEMEPGGALAIVGGLAGAIAVIS
jgi:hypothetical protein